MKQKLQSGTLRIFYTALLFSLIAALPAGNIRAQEPNTWINELYFADGDSDAGAFVEVGVENAEAWDLSLLHLVLYGGDETTGYQSYSLADFTAGETVDNFRIYSGNVPGMQSGPGGVALVYNGSLVQFLGYNGQVEAADGPAAGHISQVIGASVTAAPGGSLQLTGTGLAYGDFTWAAAGSASPGRWNSGQYLYPTVQFTSNTLAVGEDGSSVFLTVSILKPDGNQVSVDVLFQPGAGTAGEGDFSGGIARTVTFTDGAGDGATKQVRFDLADDLEYEGTETAYFRLANIVTSGNTRIGHTATCVVSISDDDRPDVVINEILADPEEDADGNGSTNGNFDDEFVELYNKESRSVDIGGWTFSNNGSDIKHTFSDGTVLPASGALVLFSKDADGPPAGIFGGALVISSDRLLQLNNLGDTPTLRDKNGNEIDSHTYGNEGNENQSLVRDPDGGASFVLHTEADGSGGKTSSPGTRTDGSNFTNSVTVDGKAGWRLLSAPLGGMPIADILDDLPIRGYSNYSPGAPRSLYVGYDGTDFVPAGDLDVDKLAPGKGFLLYVFDESPSGSDGRPVLLEAETGTGQTSDVTGVPLHAEGDGWNLLGNPFETAIDISQIESWTDGGTLHSSVGQTWNGKTGSFVLTTARNNRIAPWQGFFIENNDAVSIDFPVSARVGGRRIYGDGAQKGFVALMLNGTNTAGNTRTTDRAALLYFHEDAVHGWDTYDATKLVPLTSRYALIGIRALSADGDRPLVKAQDSRPMDFEGEISYDLDFTVKDMSGKFELSWSKVNIPEDWRFTLVDNATGIQVDMNTNSNYTFSYSPREKSIDRPELAELEKALPEQMPFELNADGEEPPRFTIKAVGGSFNRQAGELPESIKLNPNYPNPFNPSTTITFELARQAEVKLNVYTIVGQKVATLVDGVREPGIHRENWNAVDMPSGIYIAQLEVDGQVFIRKMTLIK